MCDNVCDQPGKPIWIQCPRFLPTGLASATQTPASQETTWYNVTQSIQHTKQMFTTSHTVGIKYPVWSYPGGIHKLLSGRILQGFIGDFPGSELRAHSRDPRTSRMWEAQAHSVSLFCTAPSHCFRHLSQLNYSYYLSSVFNLSWPSTQFSDMRSALISEDFSLLPYTYNYFVPFLCESIS